MLLPHSQTPAQAAWLAVAAGGGRHQGRKFIKTNFAVAILVRPAHHLGNLSRKMATLNKS